MGAAGPRSGRAQDHQSLPRFTQSALFGLTAKVEEGRPGQRGGTVARATHQEATTVAAAASPSGH